MYSEVQVISNHSTIQIVDNSELKTFFYNQNKLKYEEINYQNYENLSKNENFKKIEEKMKQISNQVKVELKKVKNENIEEKNYLENSLNFQELKDDNRLPSIQYFFNNENQLNEDNYRIDEMQQVKNLKIQKNENKIDENIHLRYDNFKIMDNLIISTSNQKELEDLKIKNSENQVNENFLSNKNNFLTSNLNYTENQFFDTNSSNKNDKNISINSNPILNNYLTSYSNYPRKLPVKETKIKYNENINLIHDQTCIYDSNMNNNFVLNDQSVNKKIFHKTYNMNTTNSILTTGSKHFENQTTWNTYFNNSIPYFHHNNQLDQFNKQINDIPVSVNLWFDQDQKTNRRKCKKITKKVFKNSNAHDLNEKIVETNKINHKVYSTEKPTYNDNLKTYSTENEIIPYELLREFENNTHNQSNDNLNKKRSIDDDFIYKNFRVKTNQNSYENFDSKNYKNTLENNQISYYQTNSNKINAFNYGMNEELKKTYSPINYSISDLKEKNCSSLNNYNCSDKNNFKNTHPNLTNNSFSFFPNKSLEKMNETKKTKIIFNNQKEIDTRNYTKKNFIRFNCHTKNKWKKFNKNNLSPDDLERKRNLANTQERKRMSELNKALDNLRQLIQNRFFRLDINQDHDTFNPNTPSSVSSDYSSNCKTPKRLSKIMTLRLAIDYISNLSSLLKNENSNS